MLYLDKGFNAQGILSEKKGFRITADYSGNISGIRYGKGNIKSGNGCFLRMEMGPRDDEHVSPIPEERRF